MGLLFRLIQRYRDYRLEGRIQRALDALVQADTPPARRAAFERMRALTRRRSPGQVERMERARGLRA